MRPILFSFLQYDVRSAPILAGLSVLAAYLYVRSQRERLGLSWDDLWTLMLVLMLGIFLGSVGLYAALYGPGLAANLGPIRQGRGVAGGSFFGVLGGAAVGAWAFCRRRRAPFGPLADVLAAAAALGLAVMRTGCLLAGCCHGRPTDLPWGLAFHSGFSSVPRDLLGVPLHPSQLYEGGAALAFFLLAHLRLLPRWRGRRPGAVFLLFVAFYSSLRFATDFLRGSDPGRIVLGPLSTAQLICLLGLAAAAAAWALRRGEP